MTLVTWNKIDVPAFLYGTAWKKERTTSLVELAVDSGFKGSTPPTSSSTTRRPSSATPSWRCERRE